MLANLTFDSTIYLPGQPLSYKVQLSNNSQKAHTYWIGISIKSSIGEWIDFPMDKVNSPANDTSTFSLSPVSEVKDNWPITTGPYQALVSLWDHYPLNETSQRIDSITMPDAFRIYNTHETFRAIDDKIWFSRDGILGRTHLKKENVFIEDDFLTLRIPAATLEGGELQTIELVHYGSYEISMKLPDAPSSITGFFLYKAPDFCHELDIEVFNQPDSEVLFTTYSDGATQNEAKLTLSFDPTADVHCYRIDYFPDKVSFYVDNQLLQKWEVGFTDQPMHLMVNTWFPSWLDGAAPEDDQSLRVHWIRY